MVSFLICWFGSRLARQYALQRFSLRSFDEYAFGCSRLCYGKNDIQITGFEFFKLGGNHRYVNRGRFGDTVVVQPLFWQMILG